MKLNNASLEFSEIECILTMHSQTMHNCCMIVDTSFDVCINTSLRLINMHSAITPNHYPLYYIHAESVL